MTLQLENRSLKRLKGIVEDLMVQVDKFQVTMDFIVLEMKGAPLRNKEHMILLGRLFMVTTRTVIDVQSRKLTMTVFSETIQLQACNLMPYLFATSHNHCSYVNCMSLLVSNPSFQGKIRSDLEAAHSKAKWKRRRHR